MSDLALIDESNPSIKTLNRNLRRLELYSRLAEIDKAELDAVYSSLGIDRKFTDTTGLGITTGTYTDWSHVVALGGYSIWKIAVSNFADNSDNMLWVTNMIGSQNLLMPQILDYQGQADSETESYLDYIYVYNGSTYSDNYGGSGGDLSSDGGTYQTILAGTGYKLYLGHASTFTGFSVEHYVRALGATYKLEYWNGSAWTELLETTNSLVDNTANGTTDGKITFDAPGDWATTSVNSQTKYWIRLSTTTAPSRNPSVYQIAPIDSVYSLLLRSSTQINQKAWAWCYYDGYIYVTIPNSGGSYYEGDAFVKEGSTAAVLKNFFIYNNNYNIRYQDSTWPAAVSARSGSSTFNGTTGRELTHSLGHQNYRVNIYLTEDPGGSYVSHFYTKADDTVTIYTQGSIATDFDYRIEIL